MATYLKYFPQPLLEDVIDNKCVPFVGAGFSRNAVLSTGAAMPLWDGLAKGLASQIPDFEYSDALDAISAFEHAYSRAKLVETIGRLLHVSSAQPGGAHKAFCALPFETVCTTNFDFLLERGYEGVGKYCRPITDEDQLSTHTGKVTVDLLKFHGDLNHPRRMVVTEEDYAGFIARNPLIATFLANQLIGKTALFIGYSLDDPDFRLIWQIVGDRLGKLRRLAYTVKVGADAREVARFERRGVRVINIPGKGSQYSAIFESLFKDSKTDGTHLLPRRPPGLRSRHFQSLPCRPMRGVGFVRSSHREVPWASTELPSFPSWSDGALLPSSRKIWSRRVNPSRQSCLRWLVAPNL